MLKQTVLGVWLVFGSISCGGPGGGPVDLGLELETGTDLRPAQDSAQLEDLPTADTTANQDTSHVADGSATTASLPYGLSYCKSSCGQPEVTICPGAKPCKTPYTTTVHWTLDSKAFNPIVLRLCVTAGVGCLAQATVTSTSGNVKVKPQPYAPSPKWVEVKKSHSIKVLSYTNEVSLVLMGKTYLMRPLKWNQKNLVQFNKTKITAKGGQTYLFKMHGDDPVDAKAVSREVEDATAKVRQLTGFAKITPPDLRYTFFVMPGPFNLQAVSGAYSYNQIQLFYGYASVRKQAGLLNYLAGLAAHEYTHQVFTTQLRLKAFGFPDGCLTEGLAFSIASLAGYLDLSGNYHDGKLAAYTGKVCALQPSNHKRGACIFTHLNKAGLLNQNLTAKLFAPTFKLPKISPCDFKSHSGGNILLVYFSEAAGKDLVNTVTQMGLAHAGSLKAARTALGLP